MREPEPTPGFATAEGTERFAARFGEPRAHFRRPDRLWLSSLALGMRNGEYGGVDDVLYRSAVPELLRGGVNLFVTALSDRMFASERNLGAALARAFREGLARRDEVVIATKGGYLTLAKDAVKVAERIEKAQHTGPKAKYTRDAEDTFKAAVEDTRERLFGHRREG